MWPSHLWNARMTFAPSNSEAPYLPVYLKFEEKGQHLYNQLSTMYSAIAYRLNNREIALYPFDEVLTGQKWSDPANTQLFKETFRTVFLIGALAAGATLTTAHGITGFSTLTFTYIGGTVITDAATFNKRPLPYASATLITDQIQIDADDTNFRIINGATAPNITSGLVVLEYLKN